MANTFDITDSMKQLVGRNAWGLRRSHGSMFLFDVGAPVPTITRRTQGEFGFLFESCEWRFQSSNEREKVSSNDDTSQIELAFESMKLGRIEEASFSEQLEVLSISFDAGLILTVTGDTQDKDPEKTEWMLFIPNELVWTKTTSALNCESSHRS
jgi:hypothetical protein